jgi:hypothetical protein
LLEPPPQVSAMSSLLILKRPSASCPSGGWNDDYDVLADGAVVGRISLTPDAPQNRRWLWTLAYGQHKDRGHEPTREAARAAAMAPFAKRRES